jgi:hypothetical protein
MTRDDMIARIDVIADVQRAKIVGDAVRAFEYQVAEREAKAFAETGFVGDAPPSVAAWATAKGWTAQQAAEDILQEAGLFNSALYYIRATRLQGKQAVMNATTEEEAQAIFTQTIASLKALG